MWSASQSATIQVDGCNIHSKDEFRILDFHVGAEDHDFRITTAWEVFWSLHKVLVARSVALSVRRIRWKVEEASLLAFG